MMSEKESKKDTRVKILSAARTEFLNCGYEKTTMRSICKKAGVTTGALYFFFENKAGLFRALVARTAEELEVFFHQAVAAEKRYSRQLVLAGKELDGDMDSESECRMMRYFYPRREEFLILMTKAQGSEYELFRDKMRTLMTAAFEDFIHLYVQEQEISAALYDLVPLLVSWRINSYLELLKENLPLEEMLIRTDLIARYAAGGWNAIVKVKK